MNLLVPRRFQPLSYKRSGWLFFASLKVLGIRGKIGIPADVLLHKPPTRLMTRWHPVLCNKRKYSWLSLRGRMTYADVKAIVTTNRNAFVVVQQDSAEENECGEIISDQKQKEND